MPATRRVLYVLKDEGDVVLWENEVEKNLSPPVQWSEVEPVAVVEIAEGVDIGRLNLQEIGLMGIVAPGVKLLWPEPAILDPGYARAH